MIDIQQVISTLKSYDGPQIKLMEVCGTHTASIFKNGVRSLISDKVKLISGPGCPVCVTPASYIDKAIELAKTPGHVLLTFGDMMKVPGSSHSLTAAKAEGARVELMYSPMEAFEKAKKNPDITYVVAAVGFETTVPTYALLLERAVEENVKNIRLLTALKTIIPALELLCSAENDIDGFISPGHVSVIIGEEGYRTLAEKYHKPFVITGFEGEHILVSIYDLLNQVQTGKAKVHNLYRNVVQSGGNRKAADLIDKYFEPGSTVWRGLGNIEGSGLYLRSEYSVYDAGSFGLSDDGQEAEGCSCSSVITGKISPNECPMFGTACTPLSPVGPCMVSGEGACGIWYRMSAARP